MNPHGMISAVVINYNDPIRLHYCIQSLINQSMPLSQIIVIDDGSSPRLCDCLDQNGNVIDLTHDTIVYHWQPNSGRAAARNTGASLSTSEYTLFLDGDCIANNDLVYNHCVSLCAGNRCVLGTNMITPELDDRFASVINNDWWDIQYQFHLNDSRIEQLNYYGISFNQLVSGWTMFWSNNFSIVTVDYMSHFMDTNFDGWGVEDIEFGYRMMSHNIPVELIDNPIYSSCTEQINPIKAHQAVVNYTTMVEKHFGDLNILDYAFLHNTVIDDDLIDQKTMWDIYWVFEQRCRQRKW